MGEEDHPALQVIVLGAGGGPQESNTTAFLVRSVAQDWSRGSLIAVDAGVHLSAITRLIEEASSSPTPGSEDTSRTLTTGPFAGLTLPYSSPEANAAYVTGFLVDSFLITHPHLDHISGFVINTAGLPGARPKKLAGLPSTIQAFKSHIFNNVIWPNLSDENNGAGLVTYLRLVEGGSPALGDGQGKGYVEICDGLLVKTWSVSHGHCIEKHSHRGSASSASTRLGSQDASSMSSRRDIHSALASGTPMTRSQTLINQATLAAVSCQGMEQEKFCVYDSSAYFIQDQAHRREVLMFGDVEPDSLSLSPRNHFIWQEAAPKIAARMLKAIFIECSFEDGMSNDRLFGHLKPMFIIEELQALAAEVRAVRNEELQESKKRKRRGVSEDSETKEFPPRKASIQHSPAPTSLADEPISPKTTSADLAPNQAIATPHLATPTDEMSLRDFEAYGSVSGTQRQLEGIKVVIIHVKEKLMDGADVRHTILEQLREHEKSAQLGCEFIVSKSGQSFYF